jgi:hypothetical protein
MSQLWEPQISCFVAVSHSVKCSACKAYPVVGLRYQCLDCLCYNLCQTCFLMGRVSKRHKLRHPMQEHCFEASLANVCNARTSGFLMWHENWRELPIIWHIQDLNIHLHDMNWQRRPSGTTWIENTRNGWHAEGFFQKHWLKDLVKYWSWIGTI